MKRRRMDANGWILIVLGVVLVIAVIEYAQKKAAEPPLIPKVTKDPYAPDYEEASKVADFALRDGRGKLRKFSELVGEETLLFFVDGGEQSRALLKYAATLLERRRKTKSPAPAVVTIADFDPTEEAAWLRETGLKQVVLYEKLGGSVGTAYKADPRPRFHHFGDGMIIITIGDSPARAPLYEIGFSLKQTLRHRSKHSSAVDHSAPDPADLRRFGGQSSGPQGDPAVTPNNAPAGVGKR